MKREAIGHTKMRRLCRTLGIRQYAAVGIMETLWLTTGREAPSGDIGKLSDEDIADAIGWNDDPDLLISALVNCGWLDEDEQHRLLVHDWPEHCDDTVHVKLARARKLFANGTVPKISRLPKDERDQAQKDFESAVEVFRKCNESFHGTFKSTVKVGPVPVPVPVPEPVPAPNHARARGVMGSEAKLDDVDDLMGREWIGIFLAAGVQLSQADVMSALRGTGYTVGFLQRDDAEKQQIIAHTKQKALTSTAKHMGYPINMLGREEWKRKGGHRVLPLAREPTKSEKATADAAQLFLESKYGAERERQSDH